ncbi:hypothetical protein GF385_01190 [Candidatus Dependentiae bacterium]|nr:hypothetical protein [Candidatus Dependentiae bacterium]
MKINNLLFIFLIFSFVQIKPNYITQISKDKNIKSEFNEKTIIDKNYAGKDISGYVFNNAKIINTNFGGCCAQETNFFNSKILNSDLSNNLNIFFKIKSFIGKDKFFSKNRIGIKFKRSTLIKTNFEKTFLIDSEFFGASIIESNFKNIISTNTKFLGCHIINTSFKNSILPYSDFSGTVLKNVDFRNCILIGSNFKAAIFEDVNVKDVDFRGVKLSIKQKEYLKQNGAKNIDWEDDLL